MALTLNQIVNVAAANTEFTPGMSSNELFYGNQTGERLTDVIATVADAVIDKADASHTHDGYATSAHTHDGYALASHTHTDYAATSHNHSISNVTGLETLLINAQAEIDGKALATHTHSEYAAAEHTHDYAASNHTHTGFADEDHTHTPASIGAATADHSHSGYAAVSHTHDYADSDHTHTPASIGAAAASHSHDYASSTHTHTQSEITGLVDALSAKANVSDLSSKADLVDGKIPTSQLPAYVDDVLEYAALSNFPATGEAGKIYVATGTNKTYRWSGSAYVEISASLALGETSATAYRGDRGKIAYDHSQNGSIHVTEAQKTAWDSKAAGTHSHSYNDLSDKPTIPAAYSHPASHPASMITGLANVATSGSYNDLNDKPTIPTIPASLPANGGNADTVDGKHASDFATASHNHDSAYMPKSLQFTADDGDAEVNLVSGSGKNLLTEIAALGKGMHTFYSAMANAGNPKTTEAWRGIVFKTGVNYGFVQAYGSSGSTYSTYIDGGTWRGWKCQYDANPSPLWSGGYYMNSPNGNPHTIYPSKKLSECRTGWILMWSDYDVGGTINESDFCTTMIPKYKPDGTIWDGKAFYCDIPMYVGSDANDLSTETRCIKPIYVHDDKLVGSYQNSSGGRNDVVLRAVYEF